MATNKGRTKISVGMPKEPDKPERRSAPQQSSGQSFLAVTAKTAAGAGLGLVVVLVGAAAGGILAETVLIPSMLVKIAAGITGGGVGLAKGIGDERRAR